MARAVRPWTPAEETRLLAWATLQRARCCIDFARATGRSSRSVRMKLCRLEKDPVTRPPEFEAAPQDAAAPRVSMARGPSDTPDRSD